MSVIVTGGAGFIGRSVVSRLRERGHTVTTVGRRGTEDIVVDLLEEGAAAAATQDVEGSTLLHLAWGVRESDYQVSAGNECWLRASLGLMRLFSQRGGRAIVIAGTCREYGNATGRPLRESDPLEPANAYAAAKARLFEEAACEFGASLNVATARIFYPYGPGEPSRKLVTWAIDSIRHGRVPALSNPDDVLDYVHVLDVAEALTRMVQRHVSGPVNVGTGTGVTPRQIATIAALRLRPEMCSAIEAIPAGSGAAPPVVADLTHMREILGVWPATVFEDGIEAMLAT